MLSLPQLLGYLPARLSLFTTPGRERAAAKTSQLPCHELSRRSAGRSPHPLAPYLKVGTLVLGADFPMAEDHSLLGSLSGSKTLIGDDGRGTARLVLTQYEHHAS